MLSLRNTVARQVEREAEHGSDDQDPETEAEAVDVAGDLGRGDHDAVDDPGQGRLVERFGTVRTREALVEHDQSHEGDHEREGPPEARKLGAGQQDQRHAVSLIVAVVAKHRVRERDHGEEPQVEQDEQRAEADEEIEVHRLTAPASFAKYGRRPSSAKAARPVAPYDPSRQSMSPAASK